MDFKRITIVGIGLLGGSLALALRRLPHRPVVVGYAHRRDLLARVKSLGVVDDVAGELAVAVAGADLVVFCTPPGVVAELMPRIAPLLARGAVVTDVCSTKRGVVALGDALVSTEGGGGFVGSHPMAGSEKKGVEHALPDLFENVACIVTPTSRTPPAVLERVVGLWEALLCRVTRMDADAHDRTMAMVSHLTHAAAGALVAVQPPGAMELAGGGFRDGTRVAAGDPQLWRDILMENRDHVHGAIEAYRAELGRLSGMLSGNDGDGVEAWLREAARRKNSLGAGRTPMI